MESPRILLLILANDGDPVYLAFQMLWRKYMNSHPNIRAYFYKGCPEITEPAVLADENTLLIQIHDTLENCYEKTLRAFDFFSKDFDKYDFIFRTNLSSFIYLPYYFEFCKQLPKTNCCAAVIGGGENFKFPSGAGFTLSIDLAKRFLLERPPFDTQDDVTIGFALQSWKIPIIHAERIDILSFYHMENIPMVIQKNPTAYHYRLKNGEEKRQYDVHSYIVLLSLYYGLEFPEYFNLVKQHGYINIM